MRGKTRKRRAAWLRVIGLAALSAAAAPVIGCGAGVPFSRRAGAAGSAAAPLDPVMDRPTPIDAAVRTGKLANGLTYYVLPHRTPALRAALWLAVDAGSVLEEDAERGVAHFIEHMAFAGTRRFRKLEILHFLEDAGMSMGADVNAHTGWDQTVYQLTVPTDDRAVMLKGLDVLRDIAADVTFDPTNVEKERGVILEEWRSHRGAAVRIEEQQLPVLMRGSRYAQTRTVGRPETIKSMSAATLARFYRDWYRPDLMAVIAVGDFTPEMIEAEIKARFGDLRTPAHPRPRPVDQVPHDQDLTVGIAGDPEARSLSVEVCDKLDHHDEATRRDYRRSLAMRLYQEMQAGRLADRRDEPRSPLVESHAVWHRLARRADVVSTSVTVKEGRLDDALLLLFRELDRAGRYGFQPSELVRARGHLRASMESALREVDKAPLQRVASELLRNFLDHEQMPGPALELAWVREMLDVITLEEIEEVAGGRRGDQGRVVLISGPTRPALPTEGGVRAAIELAHVSFLPKWIDETPAGPLVLAPPAPGRVTAIAAAPEVDATVWTLANGVRVVVKKTAFRNDSINLEGWQPGGSSLVPEADAVQARFAAEIIGGSGAGRFYEREINRMLAGKELRVSIDLDELAQEVDAAARPEDLETMLQLLHLRLTEPRRDRTAFDVWKAKRIEAQRHRSENPEQQLLDEIQVIMSGDHPRRRPTSAAMLEQVDLDRVYALWKQRFSDFGGFTFVFVGNLDLPALRPLVETWLGSLPSQARSERWLDPGIRFPTTTVERTIFAGREPRSRLWLGLAAQEAWSLDAKRDAQIFEKVLALRLLEVLRHQLTGVYGVEARATLIRWPQERRFVAIPFSCAPENLDRLRAALFAELAAIAKDGVGAELLARIAQQLRRQHELDLADNGWWLRRLRDAYEHGDSFARSNDLDALLARVTSAHVQATAHRILDGQPHVLLTLQPSALAPPAAPAAPLQTK